MWLHATGSCKGRFRRQPIYYENSKKIGLFSFLIFRCPLLRADAGDQSQIYTHTHSHIRRRGMRWFCKNLRKSARNSCTLSGSFSTPSLPLFPPNVVTHSKLLQDFTCNQGPQPPQSALMRYCEGKYQACPKHCKSTNPFLFIIQECVRSNRNRRHVMGARLEARNICAPTGERTAAVQPLASHLTDSGAPPYTYTLYTK